MVEANQNQAKKALVKHFTIDQKNSFVQVSVKMPEEEYNGLTNNGEAPVVAPGKNKILIQALDVSGSMSGAPIEALKLGAQLIGQKYYEAEQPPFEQFWTCTYNNNATFFKEKNVADYDRKIASIKAGGGTNFMNVFKEIKEMLAENPNTEEIVVIFITDGQDGYYRKNGGNSKDEYAEISEHIKGIPGLQSKFLTVGFSRGHDAVFMNQIAQYGNCQGNFIFIDSYEEGWRDNLNQSLLDSLEIALASSAKVKFSLANPHVDYSENVACEINYVTRETVAQTEKVQQPQQDNEEVKGEDAEIKDEAEVFDIELRYQTVIDTDVLTEHLSMDLIVDGNPGNLAVEFETVQEPSPNVLMNAKLQFAKKQMFDFIQELQKQPKDARKSIYEQIKQLDQQIDQDQPLVRKIKDKDVRTVLMDAIIAFKQQVAAIYSIMSKDTSDNIDNLLIAQLNDVAYKAIRKTGVQKKLDERAIKNDDFFKKLDAQLKSTFDKIDFEKVAAKHEETLKAQIGDCPLSQCNTVELMRNSDCMCIGLSIARSNATISDPSKLVIKDVYPVYMSLDSFLESSIYNLKMNQDAAGGFDLKQEGKLAVGAGREDISGVLPLFLFQEHWELAKRKLQPLFGFMCTLEPLGYTSSQFFIIPYLVLTKAIRSAQENPTEANQQILELVKETCVQMMRTNATFKEQTVDAMNAFLADPINRTADVVADINVLTSQVWSWNSLPADQKKVVKNDPQAAEEAKEVEQEDMQRYSRFAIEELMRRQLKKAEPLSKGQILNILVPNLSQIVESFKAAMQVKIQKSVEKGADTDEYAQFAGQADQLRKAAQAAGATSADQTTAAAQQEEEKKAEEVKAPEEEATSIEHIVNKAIAEKKWVAESDKITDNVLNFAKNRKGLMKMLSDLEGRENVYESILEMFGGEQEILFAMLLQNMLQPKNSNRVEAIKAGKYVEIDTVEKAHALINDLIRTNLGNELRSTESAIHSSIASLQSEADLKKLVEAPDVYIAAVALSQKSFYEGKGDRSTFFKIIQDLNPKMIPDVANKLKLVVAKEFMGLPLYNDKMCKPERVNKQTLYRLWLHCCRKNDAVTIEQMIAFQPHAEELLRVYDRFVDNQGRSTLNMEEYMAYRTQMAEKAKLKKKQQGAKKGAKLKL